MQEEYLSLLEKLITIESIKSKADKLEEVIAVTTEYFKDTNLIVKHYESNGKPSVVFLTKETKHPKLFLNGHLDVIEAEPTQFKLQITDNKAIGRGVFDMKGYVAVMMVAMKQAVQKNPNLSLGLMLTTDEEIGGTNGVEYLLSKESYRCDVVYIPDGGSKFAILTDEKGVLHLKLAVSGKAAHGAKPWEGKNAIHTLIEAYQKLITKYPNPTDDQDWKISVNLGKIEGGQATNKVPDNATMYLDFRFPAPDTAETMLEKVIKLIDNSEIKITPLSTGSPLHTPEDNQYIQAYKQIVEKEIGKTVPLVKYPAGSDGRFFSVYGIPVIMTRGDGGGQHGVNEWMNISEAVTSIKVLSKFIEQTS